jgi:hypothetical protein
MDLPATLVMIIVGAALVAWMTNPRTGQALDAWASGFIGYRSAGWPHGVQEEDPVHFTFRAPIDPDAPDPRRVDAGPEIVELDDPIDHSRGEWSWRGRL